ncbi:PQQ-dependent sugar dehydrogenase [Nocardia sp. NPDC056000]|uniref:PQQ-dependent sugar dehydrogenase n=1 Tax=Nocardia sp. NPDC056000 TaxID=3345674 RepID=UPI0035D54417
MRHPWRTRHFRSLSLLLAVCASASLIAACSDDQPTTAQGPTAVATSTAPSRSGGTIDLTAPEELVHGIDVPWGLAFLPQGGALVAERDSGVILRITPGAPAEQVYRVPGVAAAGEGGLLGLAVSPAYAENGYIYAYFTADTDNRIVRFRLDGQPEVLFTGIAKASNHNGGRIAFGPDGMLYAGTGDAGTGAAAQNPSSPNGKILRLTPEGQPAPGNPTPGSPVYSLGHRNVQGLAWDSEGRLYATEFGQNRFDEINRIEPAHNYGWPDVEGIANNPQYTDPLITWSPSDASPSGLAIAGNTMYAAALRGERLWTLPLQDGAPTRPTAQLTNHLGRLRTVAIAPDGALWLTTSNTDGRGDIHTGDDRILRFPAR